MCADVVGRFGVVGTLCQPFLDCLAVGRRVVVYATLETTPSSRQQVSSTVCTRHQPRYPSTVPKMDPSLAPSNPTQSEVFEPETQPVPVVERFQKSNTLPEVPNYVTQPNKE